ncbi:MAG: OmpA family protein, partial [Gemmatimonadota bacterium]|nr:OmpA family protein [Gemmatimonadota bacterium]
ANSRPALDRAARVLLDNPSVRVEIAGHTDATGDPQQNVRLSLLRAEAVRQALVQRGVPPQRLVAAGYGSTRPIAQGRSAAANAQNRRVELIPLD